MRQAVPPNLAIKGEWHGLYTVETVDGNIKQVIGGHKHGPTLRNESSRKERCVVRTGTVRVVEEQSRADIIELGVCRLRT